MNAGRKKFLVEGSNKGTGEMGVDSLPSQKVAWLNKTGVGLIATVRSSRQTKPVGVENGCRLLKMSFSIGEAVKAELRQFRDPRRRIGSSEGGKQK